MSSTNASEQPHRAVGIDCDFRRLHVYDSAAGSVFKSEPDAVAVLDWLRSNDALVLLEVASPVQYSKDPSSGEVANRVKWSMYNTWFACLLHAELGDRLLVAPSHVWTRGFSRSVRHHMAAATAKTKDLREAQSMIWFYRRRPGDWQPWPSFIESL